MATKISRQAPAQTGNVFYEIALDSMFDMKI